MSERRYAVEDVDGHSDFDFLPGIGLRSQAIANDLLEPPNRPFDPRAFVVTRSVSATDPTAFGDIPQRPSEWRCVGLVSAVALSTAVDRGRHDDGGFHAI